MQFTWSSIHHTKVLTFGSRVHGLKHKNLRPNTVSITYTELKAYMTYNHSDLQTVDRYLAHISQVLNPNTGSIVLCYL